MADKKTIDLSKVAYLEVDGTEKTTDVSKDIAEKIYPIAKTLPVVNACLDLYKTGKCEYNDEIAEAIRNILEQLQTGYVLKTAILACL